MTRRKKWVRQTRETVIFVVGMSGMAVSLLGGAACLVGLSSAAILRLAEVVRPHRRDISALFWYGILGAGGGLSLCGANAALARRCRDDITEAEKAQAHALNPLAGCQGCRNFHGQAHNGVLLVCAIHPYGWEGAHCPDWRKNA